MQAGEGFVEFAGRELGVVRRVNALVAEYLKISNSHARTFILDISGVAVVDTAVANHLIKITKASQLMGCDCKISGISPSIAHTIVDLGIDVGGVKSTSTMRDALSTSLKDLKLQITSIN